MKGKGFERYEFNERILSRLKRLGFKAPTEVQERVIPLFLQKLNLIVEAPTGTGKTAAYGLPLLSRLNLMKRSTQALVLAPSRELVIQITAALRSYHELEGLKINSVHGGVPISESFQQIKASPHILVAVPGRLRDVMSHYRWDYLWRDIKFLIVDEGDKLLEMGFQKDFDILRSQMRNRLQIGFFSATISQDAEQLIRERIQPIKTVRLHPKKVLRNISFYLIKPSQGQQARFLATLIKQKNISKALIFCAKRDEIFSITGFLRNHAFKTEAYHGTQEQQERKNILTRFRDGHIDFLVASDLAARGLDIEKLPAVINLSIPEEFDYYLHRVGRTGRAGKRGQVFNIIDSEMEQFFMQNHHKKMEIPLKTLDFEQEELITQKASEDERWHKYLFSRGKRDKIRKGDLVGFLLNQTTLSSDEIGTITIYDSYSLVDLPQHAHDQLIETDTPLLLKGKSVRIRKYHVSEQEKKAQQIKKFQQDRR